MAEKHDMTVDPPGAALERVLTFLTDLEIRGGVAATSGGVVATSGGADSALVLSLAAQAFGVERCVAVTSSSASLPQAELEAARTQAQRIGVEHVVLQGAELTVEAFRKNGPDRCFHCKEHLYGRLRALAEERGLPHVLDGTNADDARDHRPGMRAAKIYGVLSPLLEAGVSKDEVRALSRVRGLDTWDKPAEACLSSRFPYGTEVTREGLEKVERAERALKALKFPVVRVRVHDAVARIEVPAEDLPRLLAEGVRERAVEAVKVAGFAYVAVDLEGFRSGSLNEASSERSSNSISAGRRAGPRRESRG